MFRNVNTRVIFKEEKTKSCTFLVWLIRQPGYKKLKNLTIEKGKLAFMTEDKSASQAFLKEAMKLAESEFVPDSYCKINAELPWTSHEKLDGNEENSEKNNNGQNHERVGGAKKQKLEIKPRVSNAKLLGVDPNSLNGVQMKEMYMEAPAEPTNEYVPLHRRTTAKRMGMREHIKRHYNMRVTLTLRDPDDSVERRQSIKEWMQVVHMIDNTFLIYKFESTDDDEPLASPDQLPQEFDDLSQWFVDCRVYRNKFCFSARTSGTSTYGYLRGKLFKWNSERNNYIQFDTIRAQRVVPIGWFSNYHVDLHDQYEFKEHIEQLIRDGNMNFHFNTYPRYVWEANGSTRIKTRGLVIEVDSKRTNEIVEQMLNMKFTGNFRGVQFNPFIKLQNVDQKVMNKVYKAQQEFLDNTTSTLVPGVNIEVKEVVTKDGQQTRLVDVLLSQKVDSRNEAVSFVSKEGEMYLVHHRQYQQSVSKMVQDVQQRLMEILDENSLNRVYTNVGMLARPRRRLSIHNASLMLYAEALTQKYGNPQDTDESGSGIAVENAQDGDIALTSIGPKAPTASQEKPESNALIQELRDDINKMSEGMKRMEKETERVKAQQARLDQMIAEKIAAQVQPLRDEMNRTFREQQSKIGAELMELKEYWTKEQNKRDVARKREEEIKEMKREKLRLEREQEQSRTQAARDEELLRRFTAATESVTREVVTSMSAYSQQDEMSRLTITTLNTQDDDDHEGVQTRAVSPVKETHQTGPPSGGQL